MAVLPGVEGTEKDGTLSLSSAIWLGGMAQAMGCGKGSLGPAASICGVGTLPEPLSESLPLCLQQAQGSPPKPAPSGEAPAGPGAALGQCGACTGGTAQEPSSPHTGSASRATGQCVRMCSQGSQDRLGCSTIITHFQVREDSGGVQPWPPPRGAPQKCQSLLAHTHSALSARGGLQGRGVVHGSQPLAGTGP